MNGLDLQMTVTLTCGVCSAPVMEMTGKQQDAMAAISPSRTKGGTIKLMGKLITETANCPSCHMPVVQITGLNRGVHGKFSMSTVKARKVVAKEV